MPTPARKSTRKSPAPKKAAPAPAEVEYGTGWGSLLEDVEMPSGAIAQLRRPGVTGLVNAGVIDNVDTLTHLVSEKHVKRARGQTRPEKPSVNPKILQDPKALSDVLAAMQKIMCFAVVQPIVIRPIQKGPDGVERVIPFAQRDQLPPKTIWADQVPEEDMAFIVNYAVGGTRDLAQFRDEFSEAMGALETGKAIQL